MNQSYCNQCRQLVPVERIRRETHVFLVKTCPSCGPTETLISGHADRYFAKRTVEGEPKAGNCMVDCLSCRHDRPPTSVFVDVTNRCNQNCPICINNTPAMGFVFDPPLEYFEVLFRHLGEMTPRPSVQLFGGEPTARKDLFQIIRIAQSHNLTIRIVTNGLRLADEEYCRELVGHGVPILFAFDGSNPRTYAVLRGSAELLKIKRRALENLSHMPEANVTLVSMIAKGFNDQEMPALLDLCHQHDEIRSLYFIPLAQTWNAEAQIPSTERTTNEDVEGLLAACFPEDQVDFIPAGTMGNTAHLMNLLGMKPLPFASAHPNCESQYLLVQTNKGYVPLSRFLKTSLIEALRSMRTLERSLMGKRGSEKSEPSLIARRIAAMPDLLSFLWRHLKLRSVLKGRGSSKAKHFFAILSGFVSGKPLPQCLNGHTTIEKVLPLVVLPFEDQENLETERLERCPSAFAFYDPSLGTVRFVPTCAWSQYKSECMRTVADGYAGFQQKVASLQVIPVKGRSCRNGRLAHV